MKLIDHHLILLHRYYLINQAFTQQHHCGRIDSNHCKTDRMITFSHKYICSRTSSLSVATSSFREQWRKGEQSLFFTFLCFFYLFWRRISFHFMSALFLLLLKKLIRKYFLQTFQSAAKETRFLCFVVQFLFWPISSLQVCSLYPQPAIWAWPVSRSSLQIDEKHSNRCWRHTYNVELKSSSVVVVTKIASTLSRMVIEHSNIALQIWHLWKWGDWWWRRLWLWIGGEFYCDEKINV